MGGSTQTVQKSDPWGPAQPYIKDALKTGADMFNSDPNQFVIRPWEGDAVGKMATGEYAGISGINEYVPNATEALRINQHKLAQSRDQLLNGQTTNEFDMATRAMQTATNDPSFNFAVQEGLRAQPTAFLGNEAQQAATQERDPYMTKALGMATQGGEDPRLTQAIAANQNTGNAAQFDSVVNQMTGDGYDDNLRSALRSNVEQSVMPGVNQTFAGSGMTGSSLHRAGLAKAMAAGMAPLEAQFLDKAQDRQVTAANMAQNAQESRLGRIMSAGMAGQGATAQGADRALQAGGLAADDAYRRSGLGLEAAKLYDNSAQNSLGTKMQAGGMAQNAMMDRLNMTAKAGDMSQQNYLNSKQLGLDASGMMPGIVDANFDPYRTQIDANKVFSDRNQQQLTADILADQQRQAGPIDALNNWMALASGTGGQFGSSISRTSQNPGLLGMLGGIGQLGGLFSMLSDKRAKTDIKKVGKLDSGLPVYSYRYKGSPTTTIGVMAQEAKKKAPGAVSTRPDGLLQVDYSKLEAV